jgi:superfamily II helicase
MFFKNCLPCGSVFAIGEKKMDRPQWFKIPSDIIIDETDTRYKGSFICRDCRKEAIAKRIDISELEKKTTVK